MPYAENEGVRIHYQVEGEGPPLVLQHGFSNSLETWRRCGYVKDLRSDFRLVLVDMRGHGHSDKPHTPEAYRLELRVGDVVAVLDELQIDRTHFWGYSMGGRIGWGMTKYCPGRLLSIIAGGSGSTEPAPSEPAPWRERRIALCREGHEALIAARHKAAGPRWTPEVQERLLAVDLEAWIALLSCREHVGLEDAARRIAVPCFMYAGECDEFYAFVQESAAFTSGAKFVSLPDLDHNSAIVRSDLVLPHVRRFLASAEA